MKISYDAEIDALYVRLVDGPQECRTVRLNEEIALNIGPGEILVGIEVLDAKITSKWGALRWRADVPAGTSLMPRSKSSRLFACRAAWLSSALLRLSTYAL